MHFFSESVTDVVGKLCSGFVLVARVVLCLLSIGIVVGDSICAVGCLGSESCAVFVEY